MDPWRLAVDNALVDHGLDCTSDDCNPDQRVRELLRVSNEIALDPRVSTRASDLLSEFAAAAGLELARQFDSLCTQALDNRLGAGAWRIDDLRGRLQEVTRQGDDYSTFCLDAIPILVLERLKVSMEAGRLTARRRVLWITP